MKQAICLLIVLLASLTATAAKIKYPGKKVYVYRYTLTDKAPTAYSLEKPQRFLSRKSLERRHRQGLSVDSTDLPVCRQYVQALRAKGVEIVGSSRWMNSVVARSSDSTLLESLTALPFISQGRCVFVSPDSIDKPEDVRWNVHDDFNRWDSVKNDPYGMARQQIEMLDGVRLHEAGFRGRGITIAVLDGGFQNYDRIPAFKNTRIAGMHDFVALCGSADAKGKDADAKRKDAAKESAHHQIDHGTKVFSALAAYAPEVIIGTAPDASYWLLRCEDPATEQPIEEDYWVMAAEMADSVGADIINSSLGYYAYDHAQDNYRLQDLDGQTAFISKAASMLVHKGIILCNSAGNSGMGPWKKIGVPADAHDILTVGAIDRNQRLASFSSIGPSQDGRVKPDIVAQGAPAALLSGRGTLVHDMGTSFSTPVACGLVACLWQALPGKTALEIIELVRQSSDQYDAPTNILGYGVPDFWKAYKNSF